MERSVKKMKAVSDRFSDLPQHVVHHILSFLNTKAVIRTGVLSKSFMAMWKSFPVLDFHYSNYHRAMSVDEFIDFVGATLQQLESCYLQQGTFVPKLRFRLGIFGNPRPPPDFAFVKSITELKIEGFHLENFNESIHGCPLLKKLYLASCELEYFKFSSSVIKSIDLRNCYRLKGIEIDSPGMESFSFDNITKMSSCRKIDMTGCKSLKVLSLDGAPLRGRWFRKLIPQLEELKTIRLHDCYNLKSFEVPNHTSLSKINLISCHRLKIVEIGVVNLESFTYSATYENRKDSVSIDISSCKHLKKLKLGGDGIPKELLQEQVPKLLELEKLELSLGSFHGRVVELNNLQHLKSLFIRDPRSSDIKINAPRLDSFHYRGKLNNLCSIRHETMLDAIIDTEPDSSESYSSYFLKWFEFVKGLSPYNVLTLTCDWDNNLIIPEELRKTNLSPLVYLKHMRIELQGIAWVSVDMIDSLLWLSPNLETLDFGLFMSDQKVLSIKFEYGREMNRDDKARLRLYKLEECSDLKPVVMEDPEQVHLKDKLSKYFKKKAYSVIWM